MGSYLFYVEPSTLRPLLPAGSFQLRHKIWLGSTTFLEVEWHYWSRLGNMDWRFRWQGINRGNGGCRILLGYARVSMFRIYWISRKGTLYVWWALCTLKYGCCWKCAYMAIKIPVYARTTLDLVICYDTINILHTKLWSEITVFERYLSYINYLE